MSAPETKYGILVGVDGSAQSDAAIRFATREAVLRDAPRADQHVARDEKYAGRGVQARVDGGKVVEGNHEWLVARVS